MAPPAKKRRISPSEDSQGSVERLKSNDSGTHATSGDSAHADPDSTSASDSAPSEAGIDSSVQDELRNISFGALSEAQTSIQAESNVHTSSSSNAEKVQLLRERLADLKQLKAKSSLSTEDKTRKILKEDRAHRASKHAPTEQTSRRAVTRKRPALEVSQNPYHSRDPRFSAIAGHVDAERVNKNYSFLSDYRDSELSELKDVLKRARKPEEKERLKREINSMENRRKAELEKRRQRDIVSEHKREEREAVKQGKKPFFLKKSEQRRKAEEQKFDGMKAKEKDKVLQKRRKRESEKERRNMPADSRWA